MVSLYVRVTNTEHSSDRGQLTLPPLPMLVEISFLNMCGQIGLEIFESQFLFIA